MDFIVTKDLRLIKEGDEMYDPENYIASFTNVDDALDFIELKTEPLIYDQEQLYNYLVDMEYRLAPQVIIDFCESSMIKVEKEIKRLKDRVTDYRIKHWND